MAPKKQKKCPSEGAADWLLTYGDMTTLLLTFFVLMFTAATIDGEQLRLILAAFPGLGSMEGGNTFEQGRLPELGNTILSLPSMQRGRALNQARQNAVSIFQPQIRTQQVRVTQDERGLVISLAADAFFDPGSAELDIEESREVFIRLAGLLASAELANRRFRIEGHTDSGMPDETIWASNWELSVARSLSALRLLRDYGAPEDRFQVMGLSDTVPLASNATPEGQALNRRVDVIILTEGHL